MTPVEALQTGKFPSYLKSRLSPCAISDHARMQISHIRTEIFDICGFIMSSIISVAKMYVMLLGWMHYSTGTSPE